MAPKRKEKAEKILEAAFLREPGDLDAFLDEACAGDLELRQEIDSILAAKEHDGVPTTSEAGVSMPPPGSLAGTTLGHYEIVEEMGRGSMGVVYRARDTKLKRPVAVKVLPGELAERTDRLWRFEQEARSASALNHPNIITIHDIGKLDGLPYLVMELVEGQTLRAALEKALPPDRVYKLSAQVADGIAKAHSADIVHRDLKPENLMISEDGFVKILDFGLAKLVPSAKEGSVERSTMQMRTEIGVVMGTVGYMSPEQASGEPIDHRSDQFSLGAILYEMATGNFAFREKTAVQTLNAIIEKDPPPVRTINPDIGLSFQLIVERCLAKERSGRYDSTRDLANDLEAVRDQLSQPSGFSGSISSAHAAAPSLRSKSKWLWGAATSALAAALVIGATAAGLMDRWVSRPLVPERADVASQMPPLSLLVADFDNETGEAVFDGAIEQALTLAIEEAPFVTTYSRTEARQVAAELDPAGTLDARMARLVSRREGIAVIIVGVIHNEGAGYRFSLQAVDPSRDPGQSEPLASASATAAGKSEILEVVGELASTIRGELGDTTPESVRVAGAETFTAGSLEAMNAYARAQELNFQGRTQEAIAAYREALGTDPKLGRAYAGLGAIYGALGRDAEAEENYQRALGLLDQMTEREKYRTLGGYYLIVARNYEKAIENYETLVDLYPADNTGHANLALAYLYVRDLDAAVEEGRRAIEIYPFNVMQRTNYAAYSMYAGDFATAVIETNRVLDSSPDYDYALLTRALSSMGAGDEAAARDAYRRLAAASEWGASVSRMGLADLAMYHGRHREAHELLTTAIQLDRETNETGNLAHKYVALAEASLVLGDREGALEAVRHATELSKHESVLFPAGRVLLSAGRPEKAKPLVEALESQLQNQARSYADLLAGEIAVQEGRMPDAMDAFREGLNRHDSWFARYVLGVVYAESGRHAESLAELELCLSRRGETTDAFFRDTPTIRYLPPVYYRLGRAAQELGMSGMARENFERYAELNEDAYPPHASLRDALQRLANLPAQ